MSVPPTERQRDVNYLSLNRDTIVWDAGSPQERPHTDDLPYVLLLLPEDPKKYESILKFSGRRYFDLPRLCVAQGKENAIDINAESSQLRLTGDFGIHGNSGEQVITVKGGSHDCVFRGEIWSRGTRADVAVGLWSDQSQGVSYNLDFSGLSPSPGSMLGNQKITFILCRVRQPWRAWFGLAPKDILLPQDAQVLKLKSLGAQLHWWGKLAAVRLGLIKGRRA